MPGSAGISGQVQPGSNTQAVQQVAQNQQASVDAPNWFQSIQAHLTGWNPTPGIMSTLSRITGLGNPDKVENLQQAAVTGEQENFGAATDWLGKATSRPIATAAIYLNPESAAGANNTGGSIVAAWNASRDVSAGQAISSMPLSGAGRYSIFGNPAGTTITGGIDPTNPVVRRAAFEDSGLGKVTSGVTDAVVSYYADPTVLAGQAAKPLIAAARGTSVDTGKSLARDAIKVEAERMRQADIANGVMPDTMPKDAFAYGLAATYKLRHNTAVLNETDLVRNSANPLGVGAVLSGAQDFNEFATAYMAMRGDPAANAALKAQYPANFEALRRAKVNAEQAHDLLADAEVTKVLPDGSVSHDWAMADEQVQHWDAVVEQLKAKDAWLAKATDPTLPITGALRAAPGQRVQTGFSPFTQYTDWQVRQAERRGAAWADASPDGYHTSTTSRPLGPSGPAVTVQRWVGSDTPQGVLFLNGAKAASSGKEILATLQRAGADADRTTMWYSRYQNAVTSDDRALVAEQMNTDLTHMLLTRELDTRIASGRVTDVTAGTPEYKAALDHLKLNAEQYVKDHTAAVQQLQQQIASSKEGYFHDVTTGNSLLYKIESQGAQYKLMPDYRVYAHAVNQVDDGTFAKMLHSTLTAAELAGNTFSKLWKASVLLRIGAIPRNLGESWLAAWMATGKLTGNPLTGTWNAAVNRRNDILGSRFNPQNATIHQVADLANGEVAALEQARAQQLMNMDRTMEQARGSGANIDAYYADPLTNGRQIAHADVQTEVALGGKRVLPGKARQTTYADLSARAETGQLKRGETATLRDLHAQATRSYLRAQQRDGKEVVALRDGAYRPVSPDELTDAELLPSKVRGGAGQFHPAADVHLVPRYAKKGAPVVDPGALADIAAIHDSLGRIGDDLEAARERAMTAAEQVKAINRPTRTAGLRPIAGPGGYYAQGPAQGVLGDIALHNVSSETKNRLALHTMDSDTAMANVFAREMHGGKTIEVKPGAVDPLTGRELYYGAVANMFNTNILTSPLAVKLLSGQPIHEVSQWMRDDPDGVFALRQMHLNDESEYAVEQHLLGLNHVLHDSLPHQWFGEQARLGREITESQVRALLTGRSDLQPVYDTAMIPKSQSMSTVDHASHWVDKAYQAIWSTPENTLARFPLYKQVYTDRVRADLHRYSDQLIGKPESEANQFIRDHIEAPARLAAQNSVKRIIYSAERRTLPADQLRFIAPFLQVTGNRLAYYGAQVLENPQNMARLFLGWNAISTDAQNNIHIHLPGPVARMVGLEDSDLWAVNKTSLNLISNSEPWYSPGFGPIVTVPLAHLLRNNAPDIPSWATSLLGNKGIGMFPNNYYGTGDADMLKSSVERKLTQATDPQVFANNTAMILTAEWAKYQNHQRNTPPTIQEASDKANHLGMLKTLISFVSPVQPTYQSSVLQPMLDLYRQFQTKYGADADAQFYAQHHDMYDYVTFISKNDTGGSATKTAGQRQDSNRALIAQLHDPKLAALITNLPNDNGTFDSSVYSWQKGQTVSPGSDLTFRSAQTNPIQPFKDRLISQGWQEYAQVRAMRDLMLRATFPGDDRPVATLANLKGAEGVMALYKAGIDQIQKNTYLPDMNATGTMGTGTSPWWDDFNSQNRTFYANRAEDFRRIVTNDDYVRKNVAAQPWLLSAQKYLAARDQITSLLNVGASLGRSGSISSKENSGVRALWEAMKDQIAKADPQWSKIADRYFANDDMTDVPNGN